MNSISKISRTNTCPNCGEDAITRSRPWYGYFLGPLFILVGFLFGIVTLGLSFILTLFGIFLWQPAKSCSACGWRQRDSNRE
jgi:predicted RNA-binding Zn-ribbon protein involved in translation (DUF1610 family)